METLSGARLTLHVVLFLCCFSNCFIDLRCNAQLLPDEEVQALQTIAEKLQLKNFNFSRSFCSSGRVQNSTEGDNIVTDFICNPCNETFCHVTNIVLKGQNLTGTLPDEFGNLSFLQQIDLSRNYISGLIPTTFSQIPLTKLSLLGNRINGSIPKEIGDIATLQELILEDNGLEGTLPEDLGNLTDLKRLLISANNMTGTIPASFENLKNLIDFRIDGNRISGKIPDLIGNWTKMNRLYLQGTSMNGPISSRISMMKNMSELRILNLNASAIEFPDLSEMKQLYFLTLRNCGLIGPIPDYIGGFTQLRALDLSYNAFTGQIPATFQSLSINYMFLNNNSLSGSVPSWILNNNNNYFDISYNNFTGLSSVGCQASIVNIVASTSPTDSNSVSWCLKQDLSCSSKPQYYSLFINCGGDELTYDKNEYEEDKGIKGPAFFGPSSEKWAYSSNGVYMGNSQAPYKATNTFGLNITGGDIYKTARLAPNSLKYYGLCMLQGSYRVRLHFAEIMYSADQTFSSLGKRIFNVAIQGKVVLQDFNIAKKAKGVGKGIAMDFPDIHVNGSTLEIHLYWTGKGTTAIPDRGVYGPLISAISITPNFDPNDDVLSVGAIVGIVIASCAVLLALILVILWKFGYIGKDRRDKELAAAIEQHTSYFTLRQIKQATSNFDPMNKIGEGGFGPVYKGILLDGTVIAAKQLSSKSKQGNREFVNEIGMISALQHPNLVKLYGCCIEGNQLLLIYEYMENNSLAHALFGHEEPRLKLDWLTRKRICMGIAKGLAYLHEESRLKIVHRDIKATNVLLDKDLNAKISDFGLAKLDEEENTHISTRIAGTIGYMAPEYAMRGYLTDKADVYSFGIVTLEIVSGKCNTNYMPKEEFVYLLDWAYVLQEQGSLLEFVDPILGSNYSQKEALNMLNLALLCINPSPTLRPSMSSVVSMLEGKNPIQAPLVKRSSLPNEELRFKAFEKILDDSQTNNSTYSRESHAKGSMSTDGPWIDSSISNQSGVIDDSSSSRLIPDLYDVNLK